MEHNGFEYIDLGLSVNWATCNVGADNPLDGGLYFQWGDTVGYTRNDLLNKIKNFSLEEYTIEHRDNLTLDMDAANVYMGGNWRMPTVEECEELIKKMHKHYKTLDNKSYITFPIQRGEMVFPVLGCLFNHDVDYASESGYMWTSTYGSTTPKCMVFDRYGNIDMASGVPHAGFSIRAVLPKQ